MYFEFEVCFTVISNQFRKMVESGKANFVNKNHDYSVSVFTNKLTLAQSSNIIVKICTVRSIHSTQLEYQYCRKLKCKLFYPR